MPALEFQLGQGFVQFRLLGLSHAEIAEQMGRSENAVRLLLSRALARLVTLVGPQ